MSGRSRALVSAALFVALGLVGAFIVSAVADRWDGGGAESRRAAADLPVVDPGNVRVEILNGAGTAGLARDATQHLREDGFDVVFFGNAGRFDHARSLVLDRIGDPLRARAVAASLGIDSVTTAIDSSLMLEVTVVLGDDWPPAPVPERHWLDGLRGLVGRDSLVDTAAAGAAVEGAAAGGGHADGAASDSSG